MLTLVMHGLVIAATLGCQQGDRREAAGEVSSNLPLVPAPVSTTDPDVRAAQVELAEGRAWAATKHVAPALRTSERRTPEAVLVAARAAAGWRGWTMVNALLAYEPWLDSLFHGEGRELLARSALERGDGTTAREHAEAALAVRSDPGSHAFRQALLARALDRLDARDSAAAGYRRAAEGLPLPREWLLLRAAGNTADAAQRARLYASVKQSVARARIEPTEAQALERFGMALAAADAYEKLGDMPSAYRLRLSAAADAAQRSALRSGLLGYLQRDASGTNLQRAIEVLDAAEPDLDATSQQLVARRAAAGGVSARAASGFAKVPAALLTDADVVSWSRASIASGRP
ncbi:MAG: hypothetical protein WD801_07630, partial [Gemmatimonadaceae bacterium]